MSAATPARRTREQLEAMDRMDPTDVGPPYAGTEARRAPDPLGRSVMRRERDNEYALLAEIEPEDEAERANLMRAVRRVYRDRDGLLLLAEIEGPSAVQIGPMVSGTFAKQLAVNVLAGCQLARTNPVALHVLALGMIGALTKMERWRAQCMQLQHQMPAEGEQQAAEAAGQGRLL